MSIYYINDILYNEEQINQITWDNFTLSIVNSHPKYLYKYFPNSTNDGKNHSVEAIENNTVFLQNPIKFKDSVFLKPLILQGISPVQCSVFMYFPLFLPLRAETRESFLCPADYLVQQPCGSTLRFPCSVSVDGHRGIDIGVS